MSIDNLKLRTKALLPLTLLALTLIGCVGFGASRLITVSSSASEIIEKRDVAAFKISRAGRKVVLIPYDVDSALLNDNNSLAGKTAEREIKTVAEEGVSLLEAAIDLLPNQAAELQKFVARTKALGEKARPLFAVAWALPSLDVGRSIKPDDLEALGNAAKQVQVIDAEARTLFDDMVSFNDSLIAENAKADASLNAQASNAVWTLSIAGAVLTVLACMFSLWVNSAKIVGPLRRLCDQMLALARGDLSVAIAGAERRDEIGDMARTVETFKANALERQKLESEATEARASNEAERNRTASQRAQAAEAQASAMGALRDGLKRLADGDLRTRLDQGFAAEYADVRDDFNAAAGKLKTALAAVVASTGAIHSSTREISSASDNLSQRTEQQAASLEETAAALEEITTTVKTSAQGAKHASEVAANADSDAKQGAVVVRRAVEAMDAISESSTKIGQIISVIDEIAFQTNLLALNAGVEAARAGDSGRGFAVVASEVRALAQRSAEAAKEIKTLVSASGAQVEDGVKLVAESGKTLQTLIAQVSEINRVVADIANGAQQQATALQQINAAISQMDQSTQQNATMVEESTAASHSLTQEMTQLTNLVEQFRVGEPSEDRLRRDLKAVAPHAFAKAAAKPAPKAELLRPVKAAGGGAKSATDWTEF